jgi:dihydroorotate dehydrogenase
MLARLRLLAGDRLMLIGAGGVASGAQALAKIRAGATLVQVYTGFVEKGSSIIPEILTTLARALDHSGEPSITRLIGRDAERLAETTP